MRGRLVVLKLGVIGGLLALLMLVAAACDEQAQPAGSTTTGESPGTSAPTPTTGGPDVSQSPSSDLELAEEATWVLESLGGRPVIEVLATSKSGTLLLRRDQGEMAVS